MVEPTPVCAIPSSGHSLLSQYILREATVSIEPKRSWEGQPGSAYLAIELSRRATFPLREGRVEHLECHHWRIEKFRFRVLGPLLPAEHEQVSLATLVAIFGGQGHWREAIGVRYVYVCAFG